MTSGDIVTPSNDSGSTGTGYCSWTPDELRRYSSLTDRGLNGGHHESRVPVTFPRGGDACRRCLDRHTGQRASPARRTRKASRGWRRTSNAPSRCGRQAAAGDLRAVLAVRAVDRHGGAVRRQRPAVRTARTASRVTPAIQRLLPRPRSARARTACSPAACTRRWSCGRSSTSRPTARRAKGRWWEFSMTGQLRREGRVGGRHLRERVRARGRRVEDSRACATTRCSRARTRPAGATSTRTRRSSPTTSRPMRPASPSPTCPRRRRRSRPQTAIPATALAALEQRIAAMNDEDKVRNLQNAYGYYMDRKMWDDVTDLFTADGALSIANVGVYDGPKSIRRALERSGPAGLKHGQLNELMQLDMAVTIEPGGMEARSRGLEFGMLGEADSGHGVLHAGRLREPLREAERHLADPRDADLPADEDRLRAGLGEEPGRRSAARQGARARPAGAEVRRDDARRHPRVLRTEPRHGQAREPAGRRQDRRPRASARRPRRPHTRMPRRPAILERAHHGSRAAARRLEGLGRRREHVDGLRRLSRRSRLRPRSRKLFAEKGNKEVPFSGFYVGRERIVDARRDVAAARSRARGRCSRSTGGRSR